MRKGITAFFALITAFVLSACSGMGGPLRPCDVPDCTEEGTLLYLDESGNRLFYCETHYAELVPGAQLPAVESEQRDATLCEVCDKTGVLTYTDETGAEHLYCSEHYTEKVQQAAEEAAGTADTLVCDICGKKAVLSTRNEAGEEHYYCFDHYSEMLDMLES